MPEKFYGIQLYRTPFRQKPGLINSMRPRSPVKVPPWFAWLTSASDLLKRCFWADSVVMDLMRPCRKHHLRRQS